MFPIARKANRQKEPNHIKHLWCIRCRDVTGHLENIKPVPKPDASLPYWIRLKYENLQMVDDVQYWINVFSSGGVL
ncbi:hypothetical protein D3C81_2142810 [compost metagenome]